ncbi:uncharacterized protein LOC113291121 [Papaver somniferum]|uniref:uncharacterized protein LOC113291121 n=1 Tax=Papaver somniferum TaxID=3469 RepID=UPI000E70093C|nr:uncharacterized protein LOC113291121 [Papaver somniferum]
MGDSDAKDGEIPRTLRRPFYLSAALSWRRKKKHHQHIGLFFHAEKKPSHQGWVIVLCDVKDEDSDDDDEKFDNSIPNWTYGDCFLWNPVTLQTIQLPNLLSWITKPNAYQLFDCILSSPPGGAHKGGDNPVPVVLFLFRQEDEGFDHVLAFCNRGDKQWRTQLLSRDIINIKQLVSLHCFRGKLYAMGLDKVHLEIHLLGANHHNVSLATRPFKVRFCGFFQFRGARGESMCLVHFVECCDEFFKININYNERGFEKVVTSILVMRLDFTLMQWKVVSCLSNHVLFAGRNTAYCFISDLGLTRGCLYYTLSEDQGLYKFDIEDTAESVILPCLKMPTPWFSSSWITLPNGRGRKDGASGKDEEEKCHILEGGKKTSTIRSYDETVNKNENASQVEKHNPWHLEEEKPWCILNGDTVQLIASYLHPVDYVHFRSINKANREVMPVVKSRFIHTTQTFETGNLFPWLVFSRDNSSAMYNFINPIHNNENYLIKFSELLVGATIRYQKDGWLLLSREKELFFYNPFSRETIQLADFQGCHYLSDISFSSLPTAPDCIVFGIDRSGVGASITIYSIRRGEQQWDFFSLEEFDVEKDSASQNTPTLFDGVLYPVGYDGTLNKLNLSDDTYELLQKP